MRNSDLIIRRLGIKGNSVCYLTRRNDGRYGIHTKGLYRSHLVERNITKEQEVHEIIEYFDRIERYRIEREKYLMQR